MLVVFLWASYHYFRAGRTIRQDLYKAPASSAVDVPFV
jgi:hypothetical protein